MAQAVKKLLCKHEALSSNPSPIRDRERERERERKRERERIQRIYFKVEIKYMQ
jgi:hypothetical protein